MYIQVWSHSTLTTADLQRRPVGVGDGGDNSCRAENC